MLARLRSAAPQVLCGVRRLCCAAEVGDDSWHWFFAAAGEQLLAAQRGAQTGARSKARTVTIASEPVASERFRTGRMSLIAFIKSTPAHSKRQLGRRTLCFYITRGSVARRSVAG